MPSNNTELEKKLWNAADELRANSKLKSSEYSMPVLGLVFLKWADFKFALARRELEEEAKKSSSRRRREIGKNDYQARGAVYVPDEARFAYLMALPESADIGRAINDAMERIETENEDLRGVLPKTYQNLESRVLLSLLRIFNSITMDVEGDVFGKIYEYFLGKFAMAEGQRGGEFYTPTSIVRLIVEILEPFHGRIYDPACGSGGMFVQSARFVKQHRKNPTEEISIYGQERISETVRLCRMNLVVHGLAGDIREGNTYYEDIHHSLSKFDFVMANPPFNVDRVDKDRIKNDHRFGLGIPTTDNANYLWIQVFLSALNQQGRAGFVMANSACDAGYSELTIRRKLIESGAIEVLVMISTNFFYTVALPCTLWFLSGHKQVGRREKSMLFIDARNIFHQLDRRHREFTNAQIDFIANIVRAFRGGRDVKPGSVFADEDGHDSFLAQWAHLFQDGKYQDVPSLCRAASIDDVEANGWSLNPGRYVGTVTKTEEHDFEQTVRRFREEFEMLTDHSRRLTEAISETMDRIVSGKR